MAQCKLTPQEFIKSSFTPQIAVLCSSQAEEVCLKNKLSFVDLVKPFSVLNSDIHLQEPNGGVSIINNLSISFVDINSRPPQTTLARKLLITAVKQSLDCKYHVLHIGDTVVNVPVSIPWFEAWRDTFLKMQHPSDHEFTKHFLACLLVVSSSDVNPVESMNGLNQSLNQLQIVPNKLPKWFNLPILRYYVIIHDNVNGDIDKANQALDVLRVSFGINNCFLLRINSKVDGDENERLPDLWSKYISNVHSDVNQETPDISPVASRLFEHGVDSPKAASALPYHPLSPDTENTKLNNSLLEKELKIDSTNIEYGVYLTLEDTEQIKVLIYDFCTRGLIPYVEKQIQALTDLLSNKKGVSKSLFSATKRWFAPNKSGSGNIPVNLQIYAYDAPELQMRKLGDLYFMFSNYSMAFQVYHAAKRDFNSDQAWFYYAGALEMASLAAFMANLTSRKTFDYMEESIVTYLNTCKMIPFATRATLFSFECLKFNNYFGEAAHQLIRMTSEESDLLSALLLEQAAYCFLNCSRPQMVRKYAFHMVLAGHRFSKATQKKHGLRCYQQALQVYHKKEWTFAEDHVHYTIGKLSTGLNLYKEAAASFSTLLTTESKQSVEQQGLFLIEYLNVQRMLCQDEKPTLILPRLNLPMIKILVGPTLPLSIPGKVHASGLSFDNYQDDVTKIQKWRKIEEMIVQEAQGTLPLIFKPIVTFYTKHNFNNTNLIAVMLEPIQICIQLENPIGVNLNLKDIFILWNFKDKSGRVVSNEDSSSKSDKFLKTHVIKSFVIPPNCSQQLTLSLTPLVVGQVQLDGLSYGIINSDNLEDCIIGKQLFDFSKIEINKKKDTTSGLQISILPSAPCLQVSFTEIHEHVLCDEIQMITMEIRNVGSGPLCKVYIATSSLDVLSCCEFHKSANETDKNSIKNHVTPIRLPNDSLEPGESYSFNIWLKAPNIKGSISVDLLIYYENCDKTSSTRYRVIRHTWNLVVEESLDLNCSVSESFKSENVKELLFAVKATNSNNQENGKQMDITLVNAMLCSSLWKLKYLEHNKTRKLLTLQSQQSASLLLKAQQFLSKSKTTFSEIPIDGNVQKNTKTAYLDFAEKLEQNRTNIFQDQDIHNEEESKKEGILFLQWKASVKDNLGNARELIGQSCIVVTKLANNGKKIEDLFLSNLHPPTQAQVVETSKENPQFAKLKNQISMCIVNGSRASHNFEKNKMCVLPIQISLHNGSAIQSLVVINSAVPNHINQSGTTKPALLRPSPSVDYMWVGFNNTNKSIAPMSSEVIDLQIAVTSPGVYDLGGRLELWCQNDFNIKPVLQNLKARCCLTVTNVKL